MSLSPATAMSGCGADDQLRCLAAPVLLCLHQLFRTAQYRGQRNLQRQGDSIKALGGGPSFMALDARESCGMQSGQTAQFLIADAFLHPDKRQRIHGKVDDFFGGAARHSIT